MDEVALRELMATAFETLRSYQENFLMLYAEIAAMRDSLDELSNGKFSGIYKKHRDSLVDQTSEESRALISRFDNVIQGLRGPGSSRS